MERKKFYNFILKETTKKLNVQEELCLLFTYLDKKNF